MNGFPHAAQMATTVVSLETVQQGSQANPIVPHTSAVFTSESLSAVVIVTKSISNPRGFLDHMRQKHPELPEAQWYEDPVTPSDPKVQAAASTLAEAAVQDVMGPPPQKRPRIVEEEVEDEIIDLISPPAIPRQAEPGPSKGDGSSVKVEPEADV